MICPECGETLHRKGTAQRGYWFICSCGWGDQEDRDAVRERNEFFKDEEKYEPEDKGGD